MLCVSIDTVCRSTKKKFPNLQVREGVPVVINPAISSDGKLPQQVPLHGLELQLNVLAVMPHEAEFCDSMNSRATQVTQAVANRLPACSNLSQGK